MEARARLRHLRISPKKVRLVVDLIRGAQVKVAINQLEVLPKGATGPVLKLLKSAIANARHNYKMKDEGMMIKEVYVDQGPTLKRWRARAHGRAAEIRKKTSHITIVITGDVEVNKSAKIKVEDKKVKDNIVEAKETKSKVKKNASKDNK